ncbi:MAG TPA: DUF4340 domain-containing protein [Vicinamibacterales bacterium]|nr:DUF4340 domain-containing protein [Vicinamibacterales bacterium]
MRGGKSFLVLLAVAVALGAYIYFIESKRTGSDEKKKDKVFTVDASKIEEIEVHAASGETTTLKKAGTDWQIVSPEAVDADAATVGTLVSAIESLEVSRVVNDNPTSVKEFGLDPAKSSVAYKLAGETAFHKLNLGDKTPTGSDLYARVEGQPKLLLVAAYNTDALNRTPFDLRDKAILKIQRDGVDSVKLEGSGPAISLARKADEWRLSEPVSAKADFGTIDGLVGQVASARMKAIETPGAASAAQLSAADLKKFGFEKPQETATLGAGSSRASLQIGGKKDDTSLYARDLARPGLVFTVETALLTALQRKPDDLRVKDVFEFRSFSAQNVAFTIGGQTYTFGKEKAAPKLPAPGASPTPTPTTTPAPPEPDVWKLKTPTAKDLDQTKATDLLSAFSNLRADKFADKAFPTGTDIVVVAKFGDAGSAKEEKVTFRRMGDTVQAIRQGDSGAAVISTTDFDKVIAQLKELTGAK